MTTRLWLVIALLASPALALAQGPATRAMARHHAEVRAMGADRDARVSTLLGELIDYDTMAARIVGEPWLTGTEAQRAEYAALLRAELVRVYGSRVATVAEYTLRFEREEPGVEPMVRVTARPSASPRAEPLEIGCRMRRDGDAWRVVDIVTETLSFVAYRGRRARRAFASGGWDGMLDAMRSR